MFDKASSHVEQSTESEQLESSNKEVKGEYVSLKGGLTC